MRNISRFSIGDPIKSISLWRNTENEVYPRDLYKIELEEQKRNFLDIARDEINKLCRMGAVRGELLRALLKEAGYPNGLSPEDGSRVLPPRSILLPEQPPAKWVDRPSRQSEDPVSFVKRVYAPWLGRGLTRAHLRELDRPLYQALAKWLKRHPESDDLREFFKKARAEPSQVDRRLEELAIIKPADAYARVPSDRREADRLYQAALWRQHKKI